ncbi:MAG: spermidine/putrescine ABC transporter substrate-binding protein [Actinomycetota bacterium]
MSKRREGDPFMRVRMPARRRPAKGVDGLMRGLEFSPFSRRGFLRAAIVAPSAAVLAACTKKVGQPSGDTGGGTSTGQLEDTVAFYNWAAYLNPATRKAFEKQYDVDTTLDFFASNEELINKLKAGAKGYDLIAPTGYAVDIMRKENLLLELDHSRIPNKSNVDPRFLDLSFDPGNRFSMPKDWGTTGFGYLQKYVKEDMTTWADFFKLAPKYSGKYTVLDSSPEVIGGALKMLGYGYNTTNKEEVDAAVDELIKIKPHIGAITSSNYRQIMQRGDSYVALGWNGDFFYVAAKQPSVKYVIPTEGTEYWVDTWSIPATAPHPNAAMEFINWVLTPENQARETNYTYYASAVTGAREATDPAIANDPAIYPDESVVDSLEANDGNPEAFNLRNEAWTKFKSA